MTELQEFSNSQDRYIASIIDLLKTKYTKVDVLRGHHKLTFICDDKRGEISRLEFMGCYMANDQEKIIEIINL